MPYRSGNQVIYSELDRASIFYRARSNYEVEPMRDPTVKECFMCLCCWFTIPYLICCDGKCDDMGVVNSQVRIKKGKVYSS